MPGFLRADDWHQYAKSKVRRVCIWFSLQDTMSNLLSFVWLTAPAEHMLQSIQHNDVRGGVLRDLVSAKTNVFWTCLRTYGDMARDPLRHLPVMWRQFEIKGVAECAVIAWVVLGFLLRSAGEIWRDIAMVMAAFPYLLAGLTVDNHEPKHPVFDRVSARLFSASRCCLDRGMAQKVVSLSGSAEKLLRMGGVLASLRLWSQHSRLTNMCTERLLKLFTTSCPSRCTMDRFCSAGYLAQSQQRHLSAGGKDIRKITRSDLQGAPLLAFKRTTKRSAKNKQRHSRGRELQTCFARWSGARLRQIAQHLSASRGKHGDRIGKNGKNRTFGTRAEYLARLRKLKEEYKHAAGQVEVPRFDDEVQSTPALSYEDRIGRSLWNASNKCSPIDPDLFGKIAKVWAGPRKDESKPVGLTSAQEDLRSAFFGTFACERQG